MQDYINDSYFPRKVTIYKIDKFSKLSPSLRYENLCDKMINGIPATTQHNNLLVAVFLPVSPGSIVSVVSHVEVLKSIDTSLFFLIGGKSESVMGWIRLY